MLVFDQEGEVVVEGWAHRISERRVGLLGEPDGLWAVFFPRSGIVFDDGLREADEFEFSGGVLFALQGVDVTHRAQDRMRLGGGVRLKPVLGELIELCEQFRIDAVGIAIENADDFDVGVGPVAIVGFVDDRWVIVPPSCAGIVHDRFASRWPALRGRIISGQQVVDGSLHQRKIGGEVAGDDGLEGDGGGGDGGIGDAEIGFDGVAKAAVVVLIWGEGFDQLIFIAFAEDVGQRGLIKRAGVLLDVGDGVLRGFRGEIHI